MKNNEESTKNTGEFTIRWYSPLKFATVGPGHNSLMSPLTTKTLKHELQLNP